MEQPLEQAMEQLLLQLLEQLSEQLLELFFGAVVGAVAGAAAGGAAVEAAAGAAAGVAGGAVVGEAAEAAAGTFVQRWCPAWAPFGASWSTLMCLSRRRMLRLISLRTGSRQQTLARAPAGTRASTIAGTIAGATAGAPAGAPGARLRARLWALLEAGAGACRPRAWLCGAQRASWWWHGHCQISVSSGGYDCTRWQTRKPVVCIFGAAAIIYSCLQLVVRVLYHRLRMAVVCSACKHGHGCRVCACAARRLVGAPCLQLWARWCGVVEHVAIVGEFACSRGNQRCIDVCLRLQVPVIQLRF